jgi:putative FmdB family regulatory protein
MPTYEYVCKKCGHAFEDLQSMSAAPLTRCPKCGTDNLARVMGTGGGIIFKGSGFYVTDYRNTGASGRSDAGKRASEKKEKAREKSGGNEPAPGAESKGTEKGKPEKNKPEKHKEAAKRESGKGASGSQSPPPPPPSGPTEKKD